jgi:hypothetical protein
MKFSPPLDKGIKKAVEILNTHGFKTFESCEGGDGHAFVEPTIRFTGNEFDCLRAFEICQLYHLCVHECRRVFRKTDAYVNDNTINVRSIGEIWDEPFNEITFLKHSQTGTIFLPD